MKLYLNEVAQIGEGLCSTTDFRRLIDGEMDGNGLMMQLQMHHQDIVNRPELWNVKFRILWLLLTEHNCWDGQSM